MSKPSPTPTPPTLAELAEVLTGDQAALLRADGDPERLRQVGAAVLPEPFPVPVPGPDDPVWPRPADPVIETFLVDDRGRGEATGAVDDVGAWWHGIVEALVARVVAALRPVGVELDYPAFVTASATRLDEVTTTPIEDPARGTPPRGRGRFRNRWIIDRCPDSRNRIH